MPNGGQDGGLSNGHSTECPRNAPFGSRIQDSSLETQIS